MSGRLSPDVGLLSSHAIRNPEDDARRPHTPPSHRTLILAALTTHAFAAPRRHHVRHHTHAAATPSPPPPPSPQSSSPTFTLTLSAIPSKPPALMPPPSINGPRSSPSPTYPPATQTTPPSTSSAPSNPSSIPTISCCSPPSPPSTPRPQPPTPASAVLSGDIIPLTSTTVATSSSSLTPPTPSSSPSSSKPSSTSSPISAPRFPASPSTSHTATTTPGCHDNSLSPHDDFLAAAANPAVTNGLPTRRPGRRPPQLPPWLLRRGPAPSSALASSSSTTSTRWPTTRTCSPRQERTHQPPPDPAAAEAGQKAQLTWLATQLKQARRLHQQTWVLAHVLPGVNVWSSYNQGHPNVCTGAQPTVFLHDGQTRHPARRQRRHRPPRHLRPLPLRRNAPAHTHPPNRVRPGLASETWDSSSHRAFRAGCEDSPSISPVSCRTPLLHPRKDRLPHRRIPQELLCHPRIQLHRHRHHLVRFIRVLQHLPSAGLRLPLPHPAHRRVPPRPHRRQTGKPGLGTDGFRHYYTTTTNPSPSNPSGPNPSAQWTTSPPHPSPPAPAPPPNSPA